MTIALFSLLVLIEKSNIYSICQNTETMDCIYPNIQKDFESFSGHPQNNIKIIAMAPNDCTKFLLDLIRQLQNN